MTTLLLALENLIALVWVYYLRLLFASMDYGLKGDGGCGGRHGSWRRDDRT